MLAHINEKGIENFLMKSYCEGGYGDIIVGNDIISFIQNNTEEILNTFILVYKIHSPI